MRVAIVSKADAPGGGASRFAEDLASWLLESGHDVTHLCGTFHGKPRSFQRSFHTGKLQGKLCRLVNRRTRSLGLNELFPLEYILSWRSLFRSFDVVHFHDHYRAYSLLNLPLVARQSRVIFTAHDFLHVTGGCVYPLACTAYATHCGDCPQLATIGRFDFTRFNQALQRRVSARPDLTYVYPSRWLRERAEQATRFGRTPHLIPYAFDPRPYQFVDRAEARRRLGLPANRRIICISAHYLIDRRKGAEFALRAVASVQDLAPFLLLVGHFSEQLRPFLRDGDFRLSGYVNSRVELGLLYAAADIFLFCPLQDNLPISVQEAMAAATPVVGFATGGVPEMVEDGHTAWLVPTGDQAGLDHKLREALTSGMTAQRGHAAREVVQRRFSVRDCVRAHEQIYAA